MHSNNKTFFYDLLFTTNISLLIYNQYILVSIHTCPSAMLAYTLSPKSPMPGLRADAYFPRLHVLEPAPVIYSSHERIAFAKVMAKPPHCPHHRSDCCGDDGISRPIFTIGVVLGQLVHRGLLGRWGCPYPHIEDQILFEV